MTKLLKSLLPALAVVAAVTACDRPGPAERAGRGLDRAGERVRDTVDPPRGPGERLGRSVDRTIN